VPLGSHKSVIPELQQVSPSGQSDDCQHFCSDPVTTGRACAHCTLAKVRPRMPSRGRIRVEYNGT